MTTVNKLALSTGEYIIEMDVNDKRHGTMVVPKSNISEYEADRALSYIIIQGNTYGDKGAIEMFNHFKNYFKQKAIGA